MRPSVALVTGASSGIGAATAEALAAEGFIVALVARRRERLEAVAQEIGQRGGRALVLPADVTDADGLTAAVDQAAEQGGGLDVLVNNAGVGLAAPVEATTPDELRRLLEVNLVSVLVATQAALRHMRPAHWGHIINVGSIVARRAPPFRGAYAATKFALVGLTEALRQELSMTGISVSLVFPVVTATEFHEVEARKVEPVRRGPVQSAERVARAIAACVRHPRPEVYPYAPARALAVLSVLAPALVDRLMARVVGHGKLPHTTLG